MSYSGDAAEQVVRMSLEGAQVALKLSGEGAKQVAVLIYAILRDQKKTKGKVRMTNMIRSGKELKVFAVKDGDLERFCKEAKKYGILYCVLKDRDATDGITDVMVRAEDASKVNRIFERFDLATVDMAAVKSEIERSRGERAGDNSQPKKEVVELFLDELLPAQITQEEGKKNPTTATTAKSRQSAPSSKRKERTEGISDRIDPSRRPSVRQELNEIKARQKTGRERTVPQHQRKKPNKAKER